MLKNLIVTKKACRLLRESGVWLSGCMEHALNLVWHTSPAIASKVLALLRICWLLVLQNIRPLSKNILCARCPGSNTSEELDSSSNPAARCQLVTKKGDELLSHADCPPHWIQKAFHFLWTTYKTIDRKDEGSVVNIYVPRAKIHAPHQRQKTN